MRKGLWGRSATGAQKLPFPLMRKMSFWIFFYQFSKFFRILKEIWIFFDQLSKFLRILNKIWIFFTNSRNFLESLKKFLQKIQYPIWPISCVVIIKIYFEFALIEIYNTQKPLQRLLSLLFIIIIRCGTDLYVPRF